MRSGLYSACLVIRDLFRRPYGEDATGLHMVILLPAALISYVSSKPRTSLSLR